MHPKLFSPSRIILFALLLNAAIAPMVHAASNNVNDRSTAYAISLLLLTVVSLAAYLTVVILQPERF
jgi:K+-transporting ATPase KdpF subunit